MNSDANINYLKTELPEILGGSYGALHSLYEQIPAGIWVRDLLHPQNIWLSDSFWYGLGYSCPKRHYYSDAWLDLIHPEDRKMVEENCMASAAGTQQGFAQLIRYYRDNGELAWYKCIAGCIKKIDGRPARLFGVHIDISREKQLELQLQEKNREIQLLHADAENSLKESENIFEFSPDAIIQVNQEGSIIRVNQQACELFGYSKQELLFMSVDDLVPQPYRRAHPGHRKNYQEKPSIRPMGAANNDFYAQAKDGREIPVEIHLATIETTKGVCPIAAVRDISSRKELENTLRQALQDANMASVRKSEFLTNMSHEIRTPLNGILGVAQLLYHPNLSDEEKGYLSIIEQSGKVLLTIINDILDYQKILEGKIIFERIDFELESIIHNLAEPLRLEYKNKISLHINIDEDVPRKLKGDVVRLQQVLNNLICNAFKFTEEGEVTLNVGKKHEAGDKVVVCFEVIDTGIGISEDTQERIFDQFEQGDASTTRRYGGSGLGLSICKQLVVLYGGNIRVDSTPGKGSRFTIELPFEYAGEKEKPSQVDEMAKDIKDIDILLVEDNPVNARVIQALLKKLGKECDIATDGSIAVDMINSGKHYDLILMDCDMPVMDGFEATRRIRQYEKENQRKSPFICALTAHAMSDQVKACLECGMNKHMAKPVMLKDLSNTLVLATTQNTLSV